MLFSNLVFSVVFAGIAAAQTSTTLQAAGESLVRRILTVYELDLYHWRVSPSLWPQAALRCDYLT